MIKVKRKTYPPGTLIIETCHSYYSPYSPASVNRKYDHKNQYIACEWLTVEVVGTRKQISDALVWDLSVNKKYVKRFCRPEGFLAPETYEFRRPEDADT